MFRTCSDGVCLTLVCACSAITVKCHLLIPLPCQDVLGKWKWAVAADGETEMDKQCFVPNGKYAASV